VFKRLRSGTIQLLVATDVVGRGIDVSTISHIINFDLPQDCDDYVHRVGRTGRMGRDGIAFSFVTKDEGEQLTDIELRINRLLIRDSFEKLPESSGAIRLADNRTIDEQVDDDEGSVSNGQAFDTPTAPAKRKLSPMKRKTSDRKRLGRR
jgi:ATP-dependent RNA helicase DeaD